MANQLGANPWKLDTASSTPFWTSSCKLVLVEWRKPTTINHTMVLKDKNGYEIISAVAEAANQSQLFRIEPAWYDGLALTTLDSGTVYVHFI